MYISFPYSKGLHNKHGLCTFKHNFVHTHVCLSRNLYVHYVCLSKIFSLYLKRLQRRQRICRLLLIKLSQNSFMEVLIAACLSRCILYACIYGNPSLEKNLSWQICRRFLATTDYWPVLGHFGAQQPVWMTTKKPFSYNMTVQVLGEGCKNLRWGTLGNLEDKVEQEWRQTFGDKTWSRQPQLQPRLSTKYPKNIVDKSKKNCQQIQKNCWQIQKKLSTNPKNFVDKSKKIVDKSNK